MAQQNIRGIRLRQTENPRKKNRFYVMQMLVAMLACGTLILTGGVLTGLTETAVLPVMAAAAIALCGLYGLLLRLKHPDWFFLGMQMLILLLVVALRRWVLEGFRLFWSYLGDAKLAGTGWLLPQWKLTLPGDRQELCLMLFGILVSCGICLGGCLMSSYAPGLLAALVCAGTLVGMQFLGQSLSLGWMVGILAVSLLILLYSGWGNRNAMASVSRSWLTVCLAGAALILLSVIPKVQSWTGQIGADTRQALHKFQYETEHTTLPEGDLRDYRIPKKAAEAALIVTMEQPQTLYLRGFTGSVFENDQWQPLEKDLLVKNRDLLYWLNSNAFNPNAQFRAASQGLQLPQSRVTVQNLGACSRYRYVPFTLCADAALQPEDLNTQGVLSDGTRVYSYSAVNAGSDGIARVLEHLQESEDAGVLQYRKAESAYRQFVKSLYLQIPQEAKAMLTTQWNAAAADYGPVSALTSQQAQAAALAFLGKCFPEKGIPEDMKLPLDSIRGTSFQYATVVVLTLRYFGIPARYAEGYVITEKMAASVQPGQTLAVDGSCARAWVEVYQDGLGWIPMELMPGIGEMIQEDPNDNSEKGDSEMENEELEPEEAEEEKPREEDTEVPDPDGGSVVQVTMMVLTGLLKVLLLLIVLFLILFFRRRYINKKRERKFCAEEIRDAVAWIFADTVNVLCKLGFDSGNASLRRLCEPAENRLGPEYAEKLEEMITLNDRAMFSSRAMEEDHRKAMLQFRIGTIEQVNTHLKWYRRLWLKWVRCLY